MTSTERVRISTLSQPRPRPAAAEPVPPAADGYDHDKVTITEGMVEIPHAGLELLWDFSTHTSTAWISGLVAAGATARGIQKLASESIDDKVEGVGSLALAGASALSVWEMLHETAEAGREHHAHGHGFGPIGVLESIHGAAELYHGVVDFREKRWYQGILQVTKGTAVIAAQLVPTAAVPLHAVHLGACIGAALLDPNH